MLTCALEDSQEVEELKPHEVAREGVDGRDETGLLILVIPHLVEMERDYHYVEDRHYQIKEVPHRVEVLLSLLVKLNCFVAQSKDTE